MPRPRLLLEQPRDWYGGQSIRLGSQVQRAQSEISVICATWHVGGAGRLGAGAMVDSVRSFPEPVLTLGPLSTTCRNWALCLWSFDVLCVLAFSAVLSAGAHATAR